MYLQVARVSAVPVLALCIVIGTWLTGWLDETWQPLVCSWLVVIAAIVLVSASSTGNRPVRSVGASQDGLMAAWAGLQLVSFAAAAAALVILAARLFGGSISVWVGPTGEVLPGAWVRELTVEERSLITWLPSVDPLVVVSVLFGLAACVWGIAHMGRLLVLTQMSRVPTHGSVSTAGVDNLSWSPPLAWLWLAQTVYTAVIGLRYLDEQPSVTDEKWHTAIAIWLIGTAVWLTINFGAALVRRFRRRHPAVQLRAA